MQPVYEGRFLLRLSLLGNVSFFGEKIEGPEKPIVGNQNLFLGKWERGERQTPMLFLKRYNIYIYIYTFICTKTKRNTPTNVFVETVLGFRGLVLPKVMKIHQKGSFPSSQIGINMNQFSGTP